MRRQPALGQELLQTRHVGVSFRIIKAIRVSPSARHLKATPLCRSSRAGKSSIVARFLGNRFEEAYTPTIEEFHRKLYRIRNEVFQLDILDTSGYHPFPAMRRLSFLTGELNVCARVCVCACVLAAIISNARFIT